MAPTIIICLGSGSYEKFMEALEEATAFFRDSTPTVLIVDGTQANPAEPTGLESIKDWDFESLSCNTRYESGLDIPRKGPYEFPRNQRVPPAPQKRRVFKPSIGRS